MWRVKQLNIINGCHIVCKWLAWDALSGIVVQEVNEAQVAAALGERDLTQGPLCRKANLVAHVVNVRWPAAGQCGFLTHWRRHPRAEFDSKRRFGGSVFGH